MGDLRGTSSSSATKDALTLSLDTSTRRSYVCISKGLSVLSQAAHEETGSAEILAHLIEECSIQASISLAQIDQIACCIGPGSFTGIRTGLATSYGIHAANQTPIIGISGLISRLQPLAREGVFASFQQASKEEHFWMMTRIKASPGGGFDVEVIAPLSVSRQSSLESDVQEYARSKGVPATDLQLVSVDWDESVSLAECVSWAVASLRLGAPERQSGSALQLIEPLYGKGVNAKTLAERGIARA